MAIDYLLTTKEVADMLKVSKKTVCRMAQEGRLESIRVGHMLRFKKGEVTEFLLRGGDKIT